VNATGLPILMARTGWVLFSAVGIWPRSLWEKAMPFVTEKLQAGVTRDSRVLVIAHALLLGSSAWYPEVLRLYLGMVVSHALLSVYLAAEHRGLSVESEEVLARTRSFAGNPVIDFFFWNMPYHAEHHGWPGVPWHNLPELHALVRDRLPHKDKRLLALYGSGGT